MSGCRGDSMAYSKGMLYGFLCDSARMLEQLNPGSRLESLAVPRGWPSTEALQNIVLA